MTATKLDQVKLHRAHRNQSCVLPPTCSPRGHDIQSFSTIQGRLCGFCTAPTIHLEPAVLKTLSPSVLTIVRLRSQTTVVPNITGLLPGSSGEASLENDLSRSSMIKILHGKSETPRLAAWLQAPTAAAQARARRRGLLPGCRRPRRQRTGSAGVASGCRGRAAGYDAPILDTDTPILILRYGDTAAEKNKDSPILQVYKKLINKNNNEDN